jgi:hypothetical protein
MQLSQLVLEMQRIQEQQESRRENPISLRNQRFWNQKVLLSEDLFG